MGLLCSGFMFGGICSRGICSRGICPDTRHVMMKNDEDRVKKCVEIRVEGRKPVARSTGKWLENVEADVSELEIDREYVHGRKKWRRT